MSLLVFLWAQDDNYTTETYNTLVYILYITSLQYKLVDLNTCTNIRILKAESHFKDAQLNCIYLFKIKKKICTKDLTKH